ncbi:MAG: hypothetical protein NZ551_09540 [Microscillaceae bacterium]|nr:hypothetical protein [Microscillaceae bacterium]MDW8348199.1 hypothetical protein [Bacteroidia bacterium]MDW8461443.1 hypothetical protein [Cytophagales bacterium]
MKFIKICIVLAILANYFSFVVSFSQTNIEEVVYLKNGSIIRGIIIEQVPNQSIKIQTKDRNVFVFKYEEIEKITKKFLSNNSSNDNPTSKEKKYAEEYKRKGFTSVIEVGYCLPMGNIKVGNYTAKNEDHTYTFRWVNGYQFNPHFSFGLGVGFDIYKKVNLVPILLDARLNLFKGEVTPSIILNGGHAFGLNGAESGTIFNPQLGIKTFISKKTSFVFNIGYRWQDYPAVIFVIGRGPVTGRTYFKFMSITAGFTF